MLNLASNTIHDKGIRYLADALEENNVRQWYHGYSLFLYDPGINHTQSSFE